MHASDVHVYRKLNARVAASVWRQPSLVADRSSAPLKTGAAAAATVTLPLGWLARVDWLRASITAGYKSEGFVPGEPLSRGAIFRAGLTASHR